MNCNRREFLRRSIHAALGGATVCSALGSLQLMAAAANAGPRIARSMGYVPTFAAQGAQIHHDLSSRIKDCHSALAVGASVASQDA